MIKETFNVICVRACVRLFLWKLWMFLVFSEIVAKPICLEEIWKKKIRIIVLETLYLQIKIYVCFLSSLSLRLIFWYFHFNEEKEEMR